ncbi:hypothetical protein CK203_114076 [Vitis vinifera]|uniref:Retrotransposon gag domain-containing protein n=1 Tax=Vitis vinifera TaxID=29760 RepID=A0A438C8C1_VITVI|nr:hypothetical protein CK203_114076 [Vitis vinifera]
MKKLEPMEADHSKLKANFAGLRNQPLAAKSAFGCEMISQPSCSSAKFRSHFVRLRNSPECFQIFATNVFCYFASDICCLNPNSLLVIHQLDDSLVVEQGQGNGCHVKLPCQDGDFQAMNLNPCMPYWIRDQEGRLVRIETPRAIELEIILEVMENQPEDQHSQHGQGNDPNLYRSMRDRMHPPRMSAPSCIIPPTEQLIIRPHIVPLLPTFHGMESENPYAHIKEFEDVCNTFQEGGTAIELMRLKLFPFTLKDKAKIWLNSLRPRSIRTWTELQADFLKKFFPTHRTNGLKRQISNFSARENEKFYECWERYMEAINACPHHGFDTWLLVSYFYDGMSSSMKQILETMCGGDFMSKNPEEAMDFLSYVSEVSRGWDEPTNREMGKRPVQQMSKGGMYNLSEDMEMKAKVAAMARKIEEMELRKVHEVQAISEPQQPANPCSICQSFEHMVEECPTIPAAREMKFPSQPHQNPKGIHEVESKDEDSSKVRDVQAIITLRSGKEVHQPEHDQRKAKEDKADRNEEKKNERKGKEVQMKESIIPSMDGNLKFF